MQETHLVDMTGTSYREIEDWGPVAIKRSAIDREIERLAGLPRPANGRRASLVVHPKSRAPGLGLAPGIDVTINVLLPGEETMPSLRNSNQVETCIRGSGSIFVGDQHISFGERDIWTVPSMKVFHHRNDGEGLMVRLSYSNAPLLEKMEVHYVEDNPEEQAAGHKPVQGNGTETATHKSSYARENSPDIAIGDDGARLRGYEFLVDIEVVENKALHWPWKDIEPYIPLRPGTNQRPIMLLYNPATERRNGTTHSFFATIFGVPPNAPPRPRGRGHRHSSVAINYHYSGAGISIVNGEEVEWEAGDLLLSGPGWSEHAHYPGPEGAAILTIQDHPLHIGMESLIWQEEMGGPILALGSEPGVTGFTGPRQKGE